MTTRDVVVVGASAGGVEALSRFVGGLPADLPAAVLVVLHMGTRAPSALASILQRRSAIAVRVAADGEALRHGVVLVAPPDRHLVVRDGTAGLTTGPRENGHRPSVDALFRTAARAAGARTVAVVLSGTLDDGSAGAAAVRARGGLVLTQSAEDCLYPAMPESARRLAGADHVADAPALGEMLGALTRQHVSDDVAAPSPLLEREADVAEGSTDAIDTEGRVGPPSGFTCPDCNGVLFSVPAEDGSGLRFRCRVGHAWTAAALTQQQDDATETALWVALRTLEEKADLSHRLGEAARSDGRDLSAEHFRLAADEARSTARHIKRLIDSFAVLAASSPVEGASLPVLGAAPSAA